MPYTSLLVILAADLFFVLGAKLTGEKDAVPMMIIFIIICNLIAAVFLFVYHAGQLST